MSHFHPIALCPKYNSGMRTWLSVGVWMWACAVHAAPIETQFTLLSGAVGKNTYELQPDGKFASETILQIGPTKVTSTLSGVWKDGFITEFNLTESSGNTQGAVIYKNGKASAESNGKKVLADMSVNWAGKPMFSPYHPQIMKPMFMAMSKPTPTKELEYVVINSVAEFKGKASVESAIRELDSGKSSVTVITFALSTLEVKVAFSESGDPLGISIPAQSFHGARIGFEGIWADPLKKFPELSQPTFTTPKTLSNLRAKMRDGVELATDVMLPAESGSFPVILARTPYGREANLLLGSFWAQRGYAFVVQDVRGKGGSDGVWDPFVNEANDGFDTLDWLCQQPWCDRNIGMIGASYGGLVQWSVAVLNHPALKAIIPQVSPPDPMHNIPWDHGAFLLMGNAWWARIVETKQSNMALASATLKDAKALMAMPISKVDNVLFGKNVNFFDEWLRRDSASAWKNSYPLSKVAQVQIPIMHISGTWDGDGIGTKRHWQALRGKNNQQWLVFGPWEHAFNTKRKFADVDYGPSALLEIDSQYLRFFDTYLKGKSVNQDASPKVRFFVSGANQWVTGADWPLPYSKPASWYLSGSSAVGYKSKGVLSPTPPAKGKATYSYDPNKIKISEKDLSPDPEKASTALKPASFDKGTLLFRTAAFTRDTVLTGPMSAELYVSTTGKDATFHAMLADEDASGKIRLIQLPGTMRLTWNGEKMSPVTPNKVYKITIEPWEFAHEFKRGHKAALIITSNQFPRYARNPGTGEPDYLATKLKAVKNTVYFDKSRPSHIRLHRFHL